MSTWQIFSDTGNNFRWEISGQILPSKPADGPNGAPIQPRNSAHRLPSMTDLLLQECSKLLESGEEEDVGHAPMFRTGLGKSVVLKQSSIAKALSVLGNGDGAIGSASVCLTGEKQDSDNVCGFTNSLFSTGSGKSVNISSAGLVRAKTLLGLENNNVSNFQGFQHPRKSPKVNEQNEWQDLSYLRMKEDMDNSGMQSVSTPSLIGSKLSNAVTPNLLQSELHNSTPKPPPIKFHTAGGRSLSVSSDALERAKSLLGDPDLGTFLNEDDAVDPAHTVSKVCRLSDASVMREANFHSAFTYPCAAKSKHIGKSFVSPLKSSSNQVLSSFNSENIISGISLIKKFDAVDDEKFGGLNNTISSIQKPLSNGSSGLDMLDDNSSAIGNGLRINTLARSSRGPLVDISNTLGTSCTNHRRVNNEKRKLGRGTSISQFKRPRSSKFIIPLNKNVSYVLNGLSTSSSENSCCRRTVSTRYPFRTPRMYIKEYFEVPSSDKNMLEHFTDQVGWIKPEAAEKYKFCDESGVNCIGAEALYHMLVQSGASIQCVSKEWTMNHYKWIIWKLACYERCYPWKSATRFLTVSNVHEELKYRYEREVNHGHRSAIKRILEGDSPPSSMMVLCISAICISCKPKIENLALNGDECSNAARMELTDGWYSIDALLDIPLSKQLSAGKLFVGQKIRIWGARLCGWAGPVSPLEILASRTVSLLLHINGTYRAHWADRLGFCKGVGPPLAFRCIKNNGGPIPRTLVGVTRIYPILYKEKLRDGGSIVRSERMEARTMQLYNQRHSAVVEGIVSEYQRKGSHIYNDSDSEEGAKILKILETAAEPEVIMAEMSPEQLNSFASYQAKLEATKQLDMDKAIKKALQDAGIQEREVTPFLRVRVVGLTSYHGKAVAKEGLITIWSPTEKQRNELVEGQAYAIAGLLPVNADSNTLYLQARGSTTKWEPLSPLAIKNFQPFFNPRVSVLMSNLGEVPLSSEFDIAAYVVYVGEVYTTAQWKKQWVFVTDCSISALWSEELSNSLLAISFCSPYIDDDSFTPINYNLEGSAVGFFNLIKKAKDQINHLWIAEATENSTYSFSFDSPICSHLKIAAASAQSWGKTSSLIIDKLKEKVLFIVGDHKG
ncbi:protein BREAST CANCER SUSCEPTIBILITY 2 homolog B isoform X2 [Jatropha curcas]|uniref:protein BREAST CANCER SUSCEPTIBILITY 2 homolog B isoform X2 n=1 Tax=Jatropha curcas TaxID=180498 RepID=UPI0005FB39E4|nr:protein BREAST CANCER SUSCEPTIBILITY 2 homolog B isoform X2 [Jatropha curcas]